MTSIYSNLPSAEVPQKDSVVQAFDLYYNQPLEINSNVLAAMVGFFQAKGFEQIASEQISSILIKQSKIDSINPMAILDTLRGFSPVQISALVSEILNYNRIKTSFLGYANRYTPSIHLQRNIRP